VTVLFSTEDLTHSYGDVRALDDVTLEVPAGRIGLVGANGAGKTTLIRNLLGMLQPESGRMEVLGRPVTRESLDIRSQVGYMPEGNCLPLDQTAADFVGYAAELAGLPTDAARRRSSEILFLVGLHEERFRYLGDFSTGMFQRVKLAQAIVHDPQVAFLDEPASGLDPEGRDHMLELIRRLGEFGISVVFSSHILSDIEETCDWVVMLDGGRVIRSGPIGDLGTAESLIVEVLGDPEPAAQWLAERGATVSVTGAQLDVRTAGEDVFTMVRDALVAADLGVRRLGQSAVTLEEAFIREAEEEERRD
jgi:ABC-2 type transport system ATP-binding protein